MSFWSDSSPLVKGAIVLAAFVGLYLGVAKLAGMPPYAGPETTQARGL